MKQGTKVKVVDCINGHEFGIGEVVTRVYTAYDDIEQGTLAFQSECYGVWHMYPNAYEILNDKGRINEHTRAKCETLSMVA